MIRAAVMQGLHRPLAVENLPDPEPGEVAALGKDAEGLALGDLVSVVPLASCKVLIAPGA